jgi:HSP20 family protein
VDERALAVGRCRGDDKTYTISAELPGLAAENVDVSVVGGNLVIRGEKKNETRKEDKNDYLSERSYGAFERSFHLPDAVDREHIMAEVSKGVLTVTLPKTEAAQIKTRKIAVQGH